MSGQKSIATLSPPPQAGFRTAVLAPAAVCTDGRGHQRPRRADGGPLPVGVPAPRHHNGLRCASAHRHPVRRTPLARVVTFQTEKWSGKWSPLFTSPFFSRSIFQLVDEKSNCVSPFASVKKISVCIEQFYVFFSFCVYGFRCETSRCKPLCSSNSDT